MDLPLEISCASVKAKISTGDKFLFLDCREQDEYDTANISGTQLLPMSQLTERVGELATHQEDEVIIHCHHGGRSLRVARWLRQQGFSKAQSLAGGIECWAIEIDPAVPRY